MTTSSNTTELFVGAYLRRSDGAHYRIVRLDGTRTYRLYIEGEHVGDYPSKSAASKAAQ